MRAWIFQPYGRKLKLGDDCPWCVGWYDPEGRKKSKTIGTKSAAEKHRQKIQGQLAAGTYQDSPRRRWDEFEAEFESRVMAGMEPSTREANQHTLNHFKRIARPIRMRAITSKTIADYVAARRLEPKRRPAMATGKRQTATQGLQERVAPATINKELRMLRAVLNKAVRWGYLAKAPEIEFLRAPEKLPVYVPPEHFAKLYRACDSVRWPGQQPYPAADWWRGLLVMAYMTGWRIGALLALRWEDVDLTGATAISRHGDNKGKRDQKVPLYPIVVEHLKKMAGFDPKVFPWPPSRRALWTEFKSLQIAAGVKPEGAKRNYGFHDLRRAFATMNAAALTPDALQRLMAHTDYQTTQRYINLAEQLNPKQLKLFVPPTTVADAG